MIWPFSKNKSASSIPRVLLFKNGEAFLEYQCEYGFTDIRPKKGIVALVLDASKEFGTSEPVSVDAEGIQTATLKVASSDGGFIVSAQTLSPKGDRLRPGDVVVWVPLEHIGDVLPKGFDSRFGWVGFIVAKVAPEIDLANPELKIISHYA